MSKMNLLGISSTVIEYCTGPKEVHFRQIILCITVLVPRRFILDRLYCASALVFGILVAISA
jgi:hypothetical protein